jgi:hypothetical protein
LRAASIDGHYVAGRYRLAVCASAVASDLKSPWWAGPPEQQGRVRAAMHRYRHSQELFDPSTSPGLVQRLCNFALKELDAVESLLDPLNLAWNSLRRSERSYWLAFLRRGIGGVTNRKQFERLIQSTRPAIVARRGDLQPPGGLPYDKWITDEATFWQVAYNRACESAVRYSCGKKEADKLAALDRLEISIERPGSHQLTRAWVEKDPDLDSLHTLQRFKQLASSLYDDRKNDADTP